jgi:hypothetical protein
MTMTNISVQRLSTALPRSDGLSAIASLRHHWPEYLMEVGELGCYLFGACVFACCAGWDCRNASMGLQARPSVRLAFGISAIPPEITPYMTGQCIMTTDRLRAFLGTEYEAVMRHNVEQSFVESLAGVVPGRWATCVSAIELPHSSQMRT